MARRRSIPKTYASRGRPLAIARASNRYRSVVWQTKPGFLDFHVGLYNAKGRRISGTRMWGGSPTHALQAGFGRYFGTEKGAQLMKGAVVRGRVVPSGKNVGTFETRAGSWKKGKGGRFVGSV